MRGRSFIVLWALFLLLAPASIQAEPVAEGSWDAYYKGVAYQVVDGVVKRVDGQHVDREAAREVLQAHRVHHLVDENAGFLDRLAEREADPASDLLLSYANGAKEKLAIVAAALGHEDAQGLVGDLLGRLPVRPVDVATDAGHLRKVLHEALPAAQDAQRHSLVVRGLVHVFDGTHAVEDKALLLDSFGETVPAYGTAAEHADAALARAERALASAYALRDALEADTLWLLDAAQGSHVASELTGAIADLEAAVAASAAKAEALREDAAFMQHVASEETEPVSPIVWAVIGAAGIAAAGFGGFGWLRRRAGLP